MGVYGAGNSGAAVNKFVAPALLVAFGWAMVPQVYAAHHAGHGGAVLVLQLQRPGAPGASQRHASASS